MIHRTATPCQTPAWQSLQAGAISSLDDLLSYLELDPGTSSFSRRADSEFSLRVPRPYADLMERGNPRDPLLLQVLPVLAESLSATWFVEDPVSDLEMEPVSGLIKKYHGRALLITTGACAVHCRYCFRRHFPYNRSIGTKRHREASLAYIRTHPGITEIILSGGDPLSLPDRELASLTSALETIPHVKRLRIHTRTPVVIPQRICPDLIGWAAGTRLDLIIVLHANHPREITPRLGRGLAELLDPRVTLLNQSVLLKGVNDRVETLTALSETLFAAGVLPYYLHLLDPVRGAAHFRVPDDDARDLYRCLRERLPGYLVPTLVRETAGAPFKTPVF